jgi:hypothetical protein
MASRLVALPEVRIRRAAWDALFVMCSLAHAGALVMVPSAPLIGIGLWWNANTIAHNFIHRPFFKARWANRLFSVHLSLVLGIPQSYWRERHLLHHGGEARRVRVTAAIAIETACVLTLWMALALLMPRFALTVYAPGYALGLVLCALQGHYEHARGTTSHYGWLYNALFFNDGYHAEHHRRPALHWTDLPLEAGAPARSSRWPPVLRWLDSVTLEGLERVVLRSRVLQCAVLARHERAFERLLPLVDDVARITIVGGGLFPRSALILRRLAPHAAITIMDASGRNLAVARRFLEGHLAVEFEHRAFDASERTDADLLVIPLAFRGDRGRLYRRPPARAVMIHDWIWASSPIGARVSWLLLKRLNLVLK